MVKRKPKTNKAKRDITAGYYVVAFVDLLGQQGHLRNLKGLPDKSEPAEMQEFIKALKNTYGVVTGMRKSFSEFFTGFAKENPWAAKLRPDQRKLYNQLTSEPIQFQKFSDSAVVYLPLRTNRFKVPCSGIFGVLGATASTLIFSLAGGHPVRGGIDLGVGLEISRGEFYGSALARAHTLESKVASYPRVVVGQELVSYLTHTAQQNPIDIYGQANKDAAKICLDLLAIDEDGCVFIDFLGAGCKEHMTTALPPEIVQVCYGFVCNELTTHEHRKDDKLIRRYKMLKSYIESRLSLWQ
ncbi:hypothetical protein L4X63_07005 [Geomonas sp. Red32]|uniref:hypothetical protein n=1 Tax=Geomonas sp. Red32 TaxID=2912856 RepID=UPI00202CE56F|nr:hypothetical protein [Geomonas sp. Red32]MCM0081334.1 hypothetical protein [Geomonas sp. Red32]